MKARLAFAVLTLAAANAPCVAQTLSTASLPSFARNPAAFAGAAAPWSGFETAPSYGFNSGSFSGLGNSGTWSGYSHKFGNDTFVSFRGSSGYAQDLFQRQGVNGFNYASSEVRFGFDAGRFRPFVGGTALVANPVTSNPFVTPNTVGASLFGQQGSRSFTSVSAGFDFKVSDKITFGASVSAGVSDRGGVSPLAQPGLR